MAKVDRRSFLESIALGSAGVFAASTLAGGCGADAPREDEQPSGTPPPVAFAPSDRVRLALVGAGQRGTDLMQLLMQVPGCDISHISDVDAKHLEDGARQLESMRGSRPTASRDFRVILEDESVDGVVLALPHHWHALAAVWALQAGKHVYLEKPATHTMREGAVLRAAAAHHGKILQSGTQYRSSTSIAAAKKYIRDGLIGDVKLAVCLAYKRKKSIGPTGQYPPPRGVDVDLWSGPAPLGPITRKRFHYDWHWFWNYGNGALGNYGPNRIDVARWCLGVDGMGDTVLSLGGRFGYTDAGETPNTQMTFHRFGDRTIIHDIRGLPSENHMGSRSGVLLLGDEAYIECSGTRATLMGYDKTVLEKFIHNPDEETHEANFVRAIRENDPAALNGGIDEGIRTAAICHAGNISHRLGREAEGSSVMGLLEGFPDSDDLVYAFARLRSHLGDNRVRAGITMGPNLKLDSTAEAVVDHPDAEALMEVTCREPYLLPSPDKV